MSYVVKEVENTYKIYDTKGEKFIGMKFKKEDANKVARKMNLGGGFGEWVPDFFNSEFPVVYK